MESIQLIVASRILWYLTKPFCHVWHSFVVKIPLKNRLHSTLIILLPPDKGKNKTDKEKNEKEKQAKEDRANHLKTLFDANNS